MSVDQMQLLLRRYGGHLVLLLLAALLFIAGQAYSNSNLELALLTLPEATETAVPETRAPDATQLVETPALTAVDFSRFSVMADYSLAPALNPHTYQAQKPNHRFETYVVQPGDTPARIAARYGLQAETLLGGNPWLSQESSELQTGAELLILPVDGVLYEVREGDTLDSIAERYDIPVAAIVRHESNNLEFPYRLYAGTQLLLPGATHQMFVWTAPSLTTTGSGGRRPGFTPMAYGTGTFQWPVSGRCLTNYYWAGHPAIDISLATGTPVYAADTGTVTYAAWAAGVYYDYGNLVVINHGNGFETFYAHLNAIAVLPGQAIYKGNYLGDSGNTGRSSGPHLHFEMRYNNGWLDPLVYLGGPTRDCR